MPRWPEWCRKIGETATHPGALNVGRKLLGYLATRRETPGVQTLVKRVTLDDGTTVEARFIGDQPQVIVYAPDGQEACELYVESGMLDLGPNIAADAHKRFDRGPPEFDNRPATLYFGDGVDCRQGEPGLNGKVRVNVGAKTLKSECLPKQGRSVESRLRDPAKKKAQAMLPASCWSGLMQRYVQAVYGGDSLDYTATQQALTVKSGDRSFVVSPWSLKTTGLIMDGGALAFVEIEENGVLTFRKPNFKGCADIVFEAWKAATKKGESDATKKLLTVALSACIPGDVIGSATIDLEGARHCRDYGWSFDDAAACTALHGDDETWVARIDFSFSGSAWSATISTHSRAPKPPRLMAAEIQGVGGSVVASIARKDNPFAPDEDRWIADEKFECVIAAWFDRGKEVVTKYILEPASSPDDLDGLLRCKGKIKSHHPYVNTLPNEAFNCAASFYERLNEYLMPDYLVPQAATMNLARYMRGFSVESDGAVIESSVRLYDAFKVLRYETGSWCIYPTLWCDLILHEVPTVRYGASGEGNDGWGGSFNDSVPMDESRRKVYFEPRKKKTRVEIEDPKCVQFSVEDEIIEGTEFSSDQMRPEVPENCFNWIDGDGIVAVMNYEGHSIPAETLALEYAPSFHTLAGDRLVVGESVAACVKSLSGESRGIYVYDLSERGVQFQSGYGVSIRHHERTLCGEWPYCVRAESYQFNQVEFQKCASGDPLNPIDIAIPFELNVNVTLEVAKKEWEINHYASGPECSGIEQCSLALAYGPGWSVPVTSFSRIYGIQAEEKSAAFIVARAHSYRDPAAREGQAWVADVKQGNIPSPELRDGHSCPSLFTPLFEWLLELPAKASEKLPIKIETKDGEKNAYEVLPMVRGGIQTIKAGARSAQSGLLGAGICHKDVHLLGASVAMDRETISGGYPKVNTPSFVGWA